jgi:hypothetical protein
MARKAAPRKFMTCIADPHCPASLPDRWKILYLPCRLRMVSYVFQEMRNPMLYAILCYNDENAVGAWSAEEDAIVMRDLAAVQEKLAKAGKLGPVARLLPTTSATTPRKGAGEPLVIDGPFAETKEQFLGFFVVDCMSLEEAIDAARDLARANPGMGSYEIRPIALYKPSELPT